jgi:anti-sigma B factor antagonist
MSYMNGDEHSAETNLRPGELRLEDHGSSVRQEVFLTGELDIASAPELQSAIDRFWAEGVQSIVLDLSRLGFIDSSGLRTIIHVQEECKHRGCELSIVPGRPSVQRLFALAGLSEHLPFLETTDEQVA